MYNIPGKEEIATTDSIRTNQKISIPPLYEENENFGGGGSGSGIESPREFRWRGRLKVMLMYTWSVNDANIFRKFLLTDFGKSTENSIL